MTPNSSPSSAWKRLLPADAVALPAAPDAPRMAQLIAAAAGAPPADHRQARAHPVYDAAAQRLFASTRIHPPCGRT